MTDTEAMRRAELQSFDGRILFDEWMLVAEAARNAEAKWQAASQAAVGAGADEACKPWSQQRVSAGAAEVALTAARMAGEMAEAVLRDARTKARLRRLDPTLAPAAAK